MCFYVTHATLALQSHDLSGEGINSGSHTYFLTTQGHGWPPRKSDQPNAGATSETAQTWKTIRTKHTPSHPNKANMEWWLRRPNDIRGPSGLKASWHLSYRWGKTPKKPNPGNLSRPGIEPVSSAWQARMLLSVPQRWTPLPYINEIILQRTDINNFKIWNCIHILLIQTFIVQDKL